MADEKKVETYLVQQVEKRGGLCVKFVPQYFAGFPDRILIMPKGRTLYVETKAPHINKVAPLQKIVHDKLRLRGAFVVVCNSKEQIDELMLALDNGVL